MKCSLERLLSNATRQKDIVSFNSAIYRQKRLGACTKNVSFAVANQSFQSSTESCLYSSHTQWTLHQFDQNSATTRKTAVVFRRFVASNKCSNESTLRCTFTCERHTETHLRSPGWARQARHECGFHWHCNPPCVVLLQHSRCQHVKAAQKQSSTIRLPPKPRKLFNHVNNGCNFKCISVQSSIRRPRSWQKLEPLEWRL